MCIETAAGIGWTVHYVGRVTEVPFTRESGIYKVKCDINGLPLHFYFDTGAADVTISSVEAAFMLKNGYLTTKDLGGRQYYGTASGDVSEGTTVNLREVTFGGLTLKNVKASVVHSQRAPLLLGQTVLSRLGNIEIDYEKGVLKVTHFQKKNRHLHRRFLNPHEHETDICHHPTRLSLPHRSGRAK